MNAISHQCCIPFPCNLGKRAFINDISSEIIHDIVLIFRCALISSIIMSLEFSYPKLK